MDALISQVKNEAGSLDDAGRQKILDGLRDLALSIERPEDSIQRIFYLVCGVIPWCSPSTLLTSNSGSLAPPDGGRPRGG